MVFRLRQMRTSEGHSAKWSHQSEMTNRHPAAIQQSPSRYFLFRFALFVAKRTLIVILFWTAGCVK